MDSRIILTQADFSANNIGRYIELSELTKKVLTKQTQYDEQSEEAVALNTFLNNLVNDGFIGGDSPLLKSLFIPALASSHSQLLYDIGVVDGSGYPTDKMSEDEKTATTKAYQTKLSGSRVIGIESPANYISSSTWNAQSGFETGLFSGLSNVIYPSFSVIAYSPVETKGISTSHYLINLATNNKACVGPLNMSMQRQINPGILREVALNENWSGFACVNFNTTAWTITGEAGGTALGETTGDADTSNWKVQTDSEKFSLGESNNVNRMSSASLMAFGDMLTDTQIATLKNYINTLMIALHVTNS